MWEYCFVIVCAILILPFYHVRGQDPSDQALDLLGNLTDKQVPSLRLIHKGQKSYYIGDVFKGNFFHAEQFCRTHGMNLVTIDSQEENDFLQQKIIERGDAADHFWTSGTQLPGNNEWIWFTTGRHIKYFNWNVGEPNNAKKDELCIEIRQVKNELKWNDIDCWRDFNFICEVTWTKDCYKLLQWIKDSTTSPTNITHLIDIRFNNPPVE